MDTSIFPLLPSSRLSVDGLDELWDRTYGSNEIRIAILDGPVDFRHEVFRGANMVDCGLSSTDQRDDAAARHGTYVASLIFGQHESSVKGIAPRCTGLVVPIFTSDRDAMIVPCSQVELAFAIHRALENGANIINISGGQHSPSGDAHPLLTEAVERCAKERVLIIAAAGNDGCNCVQIPGSISSVLAVGATNSAGVPLDISNWGESYRKSGVVALGESVIGAAPRGKLQVLSGTSVAAPIVSGCAGLLLAVQNAISGLNDVLRIKGIILESAARGDCDQESGCSKLLMGRLDIKKAMKIIIDEGKPMVPENNLEADDTANKTLASGLSLNSEGLIPSACGCKAEDKSTSTQRTQIVFALGKIGYDFHSEARRDTFVANMAKPENSDQGNPYDPRQIVNYLGENTSDSARLTWTLNHGVTPIYAIQPSGPFASIAYNLLVGFLKDQLSEGVEIVSIPGVISRMTRLSTGQTVPVVEPEIRGMYSWTIAKLVENVIAERGAPDSEGELATSIDNFLRRIYFEFRNLGLSPQERAINFGGTQVFRIASYIQRQQSRGFELDTIDVVRSPICRPDSDCWDVRIIFFDPENVMRARSAYLITVDVSDSVPVMVSDGIREFAIR